MPISAGQHNILNVKGSEHCIVQKLGPLFSKVLKRGGWEACVVTTGMAIVIPFKFFAFRRWDALDNYLDWVLCSNFAAYQASFFGLLAYLLGLGHLIFKVELSRPGESIQESRLMTKAIDGLFAVSGVYIAILFTIMTFLSLWGGEYWSICVVVVVLGAAFLVITSLRFVFTLPEHLNLLRQHSIRERMCCYAGMVALWWFILLMVLYHTPQMPKVGC